MEATNSSFKARAKAVTDFDGDGILNGKELDESLSLNVIEMDWRQYNPK
ncbi:hypothetical protein [Psychroflexus sp. MES1-P1E]|nr:hypothetical protein [Psychroflexus sp. MES1-P1E]